MIYFDTSFLVPLVLTEATSERIGAFIRELPADQLERLSNLTPAAGERHDEVNLASIAR